MKKFLLGLSIFLGGLIGVISLIIACILCPLNPWDYNGTTGWYAVILGLNLRLPLYSFLFLSIAGLGISVKEVLNKN